MKCGHISRLCNDAEISREFYSAVLGLKEINRPPIPGHGYWFWLGTIQLHLVQKGDDQVLPEILDDAEYRVGHLSFDTSDVLGMETRLIKHGITFKRRPT